MDQESSERIEKILEKTPIAREKLIPLLQDVQESEGYLSKEAMIIMARHLNISTSKVFGVATFYNQFRFNPRGRYEVQICRGTACHVEGSQTILEVLERELQVSAGETTKDGIFSLEVVACIGACGLAPVISVNGEFFAKVTPDKIKKILKTFKEKESQHVAG